VPCPHQHQSPIHKSAHNRDRQNAICEYSEELDGAGRGHPIQPGMCPIPLVSPDKPVQTHIRSQEVREARIGEAALIESGQAQARSSISLIE